MANGEKIQFFGMDERDGYISWLRSEFAVANTIIDSLILIHHLRVTSEPGEYDAVVCRGFALYMQQYFPAGDVVLALQEVALRKKQQSQSYCRPKPVDKVASRNPAQIWIQKRRP